MRVWVGVGVGAGVGVGVGVGVSVGVGSGGGLWCEPHRRPSCDMHQPTHIKLTSWLRGRTSA